MERKFVATLFVIALCGTLFGQLDFFGYLPENLEYAPKFEPGAWVEYRITEEGKEAGSVKFSIISKEQRDGKEYFSFEYKMTDKEGNWTITNFSATDPDDKGTYVSLVVQRKGEEALRMDSMLETKEVAAKPTRAKKDETAAKYSVEKGVQVSVPAGKFETDKVTIVKDEELTTAWVSSDVPIIGLVKAEQAEKGGVELIGYGSEGAKTEITGEIRDFETPALNNIMRMTVPPEDQ